MQVFKNKSFTKRNYDCTNIVACMAENAPDENYEPVQAVILNRLTHLYTQNGVRYFGFL